MQSNPGEAVQLNSVVPSSPENRNSNRVEPVGNFVTCPDFIFPCVGIFMYLCDLGSDIRLAYEYFTKGQNWYFVLTVFFILVPAVTMTVVSSVWYWKAEEERRKAEEERRKAEEERKKEALEEGTGLWILRVIFAVLLLSPLLRYGESLYCAAMSRRAKTPATKMKYYSLMTTEGENVALLRLFESFMETAPQLVLVLYILFRGAAHMGGEFTLPTILESIKIAFSAIGLALAMVCYHRNIRKAVSDAQEIPIRASAVHFVAYIGLISSRVLALSLFASVSAGYLYTLLAGVAVHWTVMVGLILLYNEKVFQSMIGQVPFTFVFAAVHIFTFVNGKEGNTRNRYVFYYAVCFVEDIFLMVFWFIATDSALWFRLPALVTYFGAFVIGVLLHIYYYVFLHPVTKGKYAPILNKESAEDSHETTTPN